MMDNASVVQKIKITGKLQLDAPLLIGTGTVKDAHLAVVDTVVLKDKNERPYIPGTSLAGVLRRMLPAEEADLLFGYIGKGTEKDLQSAANIADVMLNDTAITLRDGVSIDEYTGTGIKGHKYDYEAIERGAVGELDIIITLRRYHLQQMANIKEAVRHLADALTTGIRVGALTAKGFGRAHGNEVQVFIYDFTKPKAVQAWLLQQDSDDVYRGRHVSDLQPCNLRITGKFALQSSLIVRDNRVSPDEREKGINAVNVTSKGDYLIPGSTVKGVLRHRAAHILQEIGKDTVLLNDLMGYADEQSKKKSRFLTDEVYFSKNVKAVKQTRNVIDRFTGSTMDSKLFSEKPLWQDGEEASLTISYEIVSCREPEAGLALFLLRDLAQGYIALGGESSVGRGYLRGCGATIAYQGKKWELDAAGKVIRGKQSELEALAQALLTYNEGGRA